MPLIAVPIVDSALQFATALINYRAALLKDATSEQKQALIQVDVNFANSWNKFIDIISNLKLE